MRPLCGCDLQTNTAIEGSETISLTLSSPTNATLGTSSATMTILDDDGGAQPSEEFYTYDAIGNLLSKTGVGTYSYPATGSAHPHAVSSITSGTSTITYTYDLNGNMTGRGGLLTTWDEENRPLTINTSSGSESYAYDADGERVKVVAGSTTTVYLGGLWEETSAGATKAYYTFGGQVVAVRDSASGVAYLHGDHLGSVSVASGAGASLLSSQRFDPWGKRISGGISQTGKNYTGQYLDTTGLLYYHARYYDPTLARFVSADSVVPGATGLSIGPDKQSNGPAIPQDLNRYSYGENNPVKNTDPTGHCVPWCTALAGAVIGAGIAYGAQVYSNYQSGMSLSQAATSNINVAAIATAAVAGAVVGGTLGIASTGAITGYTVGTAVQLGAIGSATNMAGNALGQYASSGTVNVTDVAVAGVVGFAAGAAAPVVGATAVGSMAGGYVGSVGLGAAANTAQYVATQSIKGDQITGMGLAVNAISGGISGVVGGPTSKVPTALSFDTAEKGLSRAVNAQDFLRANVTRAGLTRGFLSGATSNWNYDQYMAR